MDPQPGLRPPRLLNRRDFLKMGGLAGAASLAAACTRSSRGDQRVPTPVPPPGGSWSSTVAAAAARSDVSLRIAHISDMHIEPSGPGPDGFARALQLIQSLAVPVDFVLNTGDCVMDSLEANKDRAQRQWDSFTAVLKAECSLPVFHAIGNHDVWGWGLPPEPRSDASGDPLFGKGLAVQQLGLARPYYSFERGGWRFIVLDSTHLPDLTTGLPYTGKLDEDQYQWLAQELDATSSSTHICIVSHIPILAACEYLDGENETSGNWIVPGAWMHIDARRLWRLFWQYRNVRLCLSGHTHQIEDLRYHGVNYLTNGAICANWWRGPYFDFPPGFVLVNLYADGSASTEFVAY